MLTFDLFFNMGCNKRQVQGSVLTLDLFLDIGCNKRQVQGLVLTSDLVLIIGCNKTKVLSVQLKKTLGLTTVPISETRETDPLYSKVPAMLSL